MSHRPSSAPPLDVPRAPAYLIDRKYLFSSKAELWGVGGNTAKPIQLDDDHSRLLACLLEAGGSYASVVTERLIRQRHPQLNKRKISQAKDSAEEFEAAKDRWRKAANKLHDRVPELILERADGEYRLDNAVELVDEREFLGAPSNWVVPTLEAVEFQQAGYVARRLSPSPQSSPPAGLLGEVPENSYSTSAEFKVFRDLCSATGQARALWVVHGEPGAGKSRLAEHWHAKLLQADPSRSLGTVLVRFRDLARLTLGADGLAATLLSARSPLPDAPSTPHVSPHVWILDGWDEGPAYCQQAAFVQRLAQLPGIKLVTTRTSLLGTLDSFGFCELQSAERRYQIQGLNRTEQFQLAELTLSSNAAQRLIHDVSRDRTLRKLAAVPFLLEGMVQLADGEGKLNAPDSRLDFFYRMVDEKWKRLTAEKGLPRDTSAEEIETDAVLQQLTLRLGPDKSQFDTREVAGIIKAHVTTLEDRNNLLDYLLKTGILQRVAGFGKRLEFAHQTYLEFYLGRAWVSPEHGWSLAQALARHWDDPTYDVALGFAVAELARQQRFTELTDVVVHHIDHFDRIRQDAPQQWSALRRNPVRAVLAILSQSGVVQTAQTSELWALLAAKTQGALPEPETLELQAFLALTLQ